MILTNVGAQLLVQFDANSMSLLVCTTRTTRKSAVAQTKAIALLD